MPNLTQSTTYVLMLLQNGTIVKKQAIKTTSFTYITGVTTSIITESSTKYCQISNIIINPEFTNFTAFYILITNQDTGAQFGQDLNKTLYQGGTIVNLGTSNATAVANYQLKIYCIADDLTEYANNEQVTNLLDSTITYYLIYTHPMYINF